MTYPVHRKGELVVLREWRSGELAGMHRWLADPRVNRFLSWGSSSLEASAAQLRETVAAQTARPREKYYLAIEVIGRAGTTIGNAGFSWIGDEVAEIGYFLEPEYWGRGYATDAARLLIELAFELNARRVIATCDEENQASAAVMQRCGMSPGPSPDPGRLFYETRGSG